MRKFFLTAAFLLGAAAAAPGASLRITVGTTPDAAKMPAVSVLIGVASPDDDIADGYAATLRYLDARGQPVAVTRLCLTTSSQCRIDWILEPGSTVIADPNAVVIRVFHFTVDASGNTLSYPFPAPFGE